MKTNIENLTIGSFAGLAGVNVESIRFYQRKRLLPEPNRPPGSIRRYGAADVARVKFIKSAQRLGFTLDEVAGLLQLEDGAHCDEARTIAEQKLGEVRDKLRHLHLIESTLAQLVDDCCSSRGRVKCPMINSLASGADEGLPP
jgi:MerR family mercuric resistance operon transcriptional regulator